MAASDLPHSKSEIDRAGEELRKWWVQADPEAPFEVPLDVVFDFRARFQNPMRKVTVGLRQFVAGESEPGVAITVGQRLKRAPQIVEKLARHPRMKLSRMQDIGGCRAILANEDHVAAVEQRIRRNWDVKHTKHYTLERPAPTGYRATHVVVERDGRLVEIQLRTPNQHAWAEAVERTDKRLGFRLKAGEGPADLLEYFRLAADGLAQQEAGITSSQDFLREFEAARDRVRPFFERS